jgi:membrane protein DedA with SNARE-associated domain
MGQLVEGLLQLSGGAALACLFLLPALEAPAFLGLVLPGELALVLGGVLAGQGRVPLAVALAAGVGTGDRGCWPLAWAAGSAVAHVLLGYAAGAGWRHANRLPGQVGLALAGAVVVALSVAWVVRRSARRLSRRSPVAAGAGPSARRRARPPAG